MISFDEYCRRKEAAAAAANIPGYAAIFSDAGTYVLRLTATDTALSAFDEVTVTVDPRNQPPVVNAGTDQNIRLPNTAALSGSATDDGYGTHNDDQASTA